MEERLKEKFDAHMKMAEFAGARHDGRRAYEWKITLGLWTILLLAIRNRTHLEIPQFGLLVIAILIVILDACWLRGIYRTNQEDGGISRYHRDAAGKILGIVHERSSEEPKWKKRIGFLGHWSLSFQFGTTVLLVFVAFWIVSQP